MRYRIFFASRQDFNKSMLLGSMVPAAFCMIATAWIGRLVLGDLGLLGGGLFGIVCCIALMQKGRLFDFKR